MFKFSSVGKRTFYSAKRFSSTGGAQEQSKFGQAIRFVSKNRQQLINIFAIYLVVSFGVHNYKVQKAWEEREEQVRQVIAESNTLKESLLSKEWIAEVDKKVRASKPVHNVLLAELGARLAAFPVNDSVAKVVAAETQAAPAETPVSKTVGKDPVGIAVNSGAKDSGRVI